MSCLEVNYVFEWHYHSYCHYCLGKEIDFYKELQTTT